ncbi:MAG: glycine cleavage system aminomethyltransferase GcvT [Planctomyces sp.]|nr:glycine cleavage system aminomethyltransferase GcvT [Planctomyces sp.]
MMQTQFHEWHVARGGRMVDFAGWSMPVQYTSIIDEHQAVRERVGLFDISHMGRIEFRGRDAVPFLDTLLTNSVAALAPGQVRYSLMCREDGGILDDVLVYRLQAGLDVAPTHLLVVNASNREKIVAWIEARRGDLDVEVDDRTFAWSMLALQGPLACGLFARYGTPDPAPHKYYTAWLADTPRGRVIASRTGYTGEDGIELMIPREIGEGVLDDLWKLGAGHGLAACGLGCRDTLRLEAAMPLYGHELSEQIDPLTAGLGFAVKLDKGDFVGAAALRRIAERGPDRVRVGLTLAGRRIAREHSHILAGDRQIGEVTSGTFSPTLQKSIAMGYVEPGFTAAGTAALADIRGKTEAAIITALPFYKRSRKD